MLELDQKKSVIKPALDDTAYNALEKEYVDVMRELADNSGLDRYKDEYGKLMRALEKSHENEKKLMKKCRDLKAQVVSNTAKVTQASKIASEDPTNITALKREVEQAWKMVETATEKEIKARELIERLKGEIAHLSKLVEQGEATGVANLAEMTKTKERLVVERDEQQHENQQLREQLEEIRNRTAGYQNAIVEAQAHISELTQEITVRNAEAQRELKRKERMERELNQVRSEVEAKMEEIKTATENMEALGIELNTKQEKNKTTKVALEQANRQLQLTEMKLKDAQAKLEQQIQVTDSVMIENQGRLQEVKQKEEEVNSLKAEFNKITRQKESSIRKVRTLEEEKTNLEDTRDRLRQEIQIYDDRLEAMRKKQEADRRECDELAKEKEQMNKELAKAVAQTNKQLSILRLHELSRQNLEQEIENYKEESQKQRKIIYKLEKDRDRYITDSAELTQKVLQNMDELKYREMQIFETKKKIAEAETKLKQQQNLYEAVRSDRNLYSKSLMDAQEDIAEMKRKLKIVSHQIGQLKDDIATKEAVLVKENLDRQRIDREKEQLARELQSMKVQAAENHAYIEAQEAEEGKLNKIVAEAEQERLREKKEYQQVVSERNILGSQLVRRNEELAALYEKIRIQHSVLAKGERQYNQRLRELGKLRQDVRDLRRKKAMMQVTVSKVEDIKAELHRVQKELVREKTRTTALQQELQNPINVHRWRKLEIYYFDGWRELNYLPEGTDPSTYEMILKIQALQKRLINKTEEVVEKELMIQEKEKLYIELKHILARQPGPEVAEQLNIYQAMIREKTRQIKCMAGEMNMYENQITQFKGELGILEKELDGIKNKYFKQKQQIDMELFDDDDPQADKYKAKQEENSEPHDAKN